MHYFKNNPSPFQYKGSPEPPKKKLKTEKKQKVTELDICVASFNLLSSTPEHFTEIWNWSYFIEKFSNHEDSEIRWIVCQTVAILYGMSETEKLKLIMQSISTKNNRMYSLKYFATNKKMFEEMTHPLKEKVTHSNHFT